MFDSTAVYSARGNIYAVINPGVAGQLADVPIDHKAAASFLSRHGRTFAEKAISSLKTGERPSRGHRSVLDGFVIGPFSVEGGLGAIIVNTDGTLAERSGNGLTNFARYLDARGMFNRRGLNNIMVRTGERVTSKMIGAGNIHGHTGYWLEMGCIRFGTDAVDADPEQVNDNGDGSFTVPPLVRLSSSWGQSVLASVGNPHCITFLDDQEKLKTNRQLRSPLMFGALKAIAFKPNDRGTPFKNGVNLQWAKVAPTGRAIGARIFERGEGPTASSGTSATAIAAASRYLGLTSADRLRVMTPGGTAYVELAGGSHHMTARFFGLSQRFEGNI